MEDWGLEPWDVKERQDQGDEERTVLPHLQHWCRLDIQRALGIPVCFQETRSASFLRTLLLPIPSPALNSQAQSLLPSQ